MSRFFSWMAIGVAGVFLIVVTASFSLSAIMWLAFALAIGTLVVSAGLAVAYYRDVATLVTAVVTAVVSAWTIVASLVFSLGTVSSLALASGIAIGALALIGGSAHEIENQLALSRSRADSHSVNGERESNLAAAA